MKAAHAIPRQGPGELLIEWLRHAADPKGEKMAVACPGVDSQVLATILDPFRVIFVDLGPDRLFGGCGTLV